MPKFTYDMEGEWIATIGDYLVTKIPETGKFIVHGPNNQTKSFGTRNQAIEFAKSERAEARRQHDYTTREYEP
jgi:hypothetical protein